MSVGVVRGVTADLSRRDVDAAPSPAEAAAFVDDYSAARGEPLPRPVRDEALAVVAYVLAYTARCEHAFAGEGDFTRALRRWGAAYLP